MCPSPPPPAFEALYVEHHGWLRTWLRRRLGNAWDAADVAHDTFLRLMARSDPVCPREPRALLTTVARGEVANLLRRRRIEAAYAAALAAAPAAHAPSPESRAMVLDTLIELDRRLDTLPAPVREAFLLARLHGMKHKDIARRLAVSLATVERHLVRATHLCVFGS